MTQVTYDESIIINALDISVFSRAYLEKMHSSGITAANVTVTAVHSCRETMDLIGKWYRRLEENADIVMQATSAEDILLAKRIGKTALVLGFQNTTPIDDNGDLLAIYRKLGVLIMQLTYNARNLVGDGCVEPSNAGLSEFGRDVVRETNRLRILIDLSHVGERTTLEAIELSERPCAFTHANVRALCESARNKSDECLRALAAKGGVVGVNAWPAFLCKEDPCLDDLLNHIDYLANLVGVDRVGLGLDFTEGQPYEFFTTRLGLGAFHPVGILPSWPIVFPKGIESVSDIRNIWKALVERGYSQSEVQGIMGENFLRLFRQVWGE